MRRCFLLLAFIAPTLAIKVPVGDTDTGVNEESDKKSTTQKPVYYETNADVDSYLVPPSPHKPDDEGPDTPPTYLVPPLEHSQNEFYQVGGGEQTKWLPMVTPPIQHPQRFKSKLEPNEISKIHVPSRELEPPIKEAIVFNTEQMLPEVNIHHQFRIPEDTQSSGEINTKLEQQLTQAQALEQIYQLPSPDKVNVPVPSSELLTPLHEHVPFRTVPREPQRTLALRLTPPPPPSPVPFVKPIQIKINAKPYPYPTRLFPKKHVSFKRIPIPISQYAENYKAFPEPELQDNISTNNDKKIFQYEQLEQKRRLKNKDEPKEQVEVDSAEEQSYSNGTGPEQEASETNFRLPGRRYPVRFVPQPQALVHQPEPTTTSEAPVPKERTEFRMHGMKGPHSYQFGYDTGKGKNRQFRFEERDNDGRVKGHYGYMDRSGKLRVFNYNADPDTGFHSEPQEPTR